MTRSSQDQDPRDARSSEPAMDAPGQGIDAPLDVQTASSPTSEADPKDEAAKPDEDVAPLLKEGAGAPDAADIEDPETQL